MHDFVYDKNHPLEGEGNIFKTKSPPTAHLHSHQIIFLREFFGKIKIIIERGGKENDKRNNRRDFAGY